MANRAYHSAPGGGGAWWSRAGNVPLEQREQCEQPQRHTPEEESSRVGGEPEMNQEDRAIEQGAEHHPGREANDLSELLGAHNACIGLAIDFEQGDLAQNAARLLTEWP